MGVPVWMGVATCLSLASFCCESKLAIFTNIIWCVPKYKKIITQGHFIRTINFLVVDRWRMCRIFLSQETLRRTSRGTKSRRTIVQFIARVTGLVEANQETLIIG